MLRFVRPVLVFAAAAVAACSGSTPSAPGGGPAIVPAAAIANPGAATPSAPPAPAPSSAAAAPLAVLGYVPDPTSVKIDLAPVAGARDYRIYSSDAPGRVRYAGLVSDGRGGFAPSTQIEWNGLEPGGAATLIAEAVDAPGPFPVSNVESAPSPACLGTWRPARQAPLPPLAAPGAESVPIEGADFGPVADGIALGGEGCPANRPHVLARSAPFVVRAAANDPIPSSAATAGSAVFVSFTDAQAATLAPIVAGDTEAGTATLTLGAPPATFTILEDGADVLNSRVFILDGHLIDVLYDGPAPTPHAGRASLALVPNATADLSGGRILHATMEVDARTDAHRSIGFELGPAGDPLTNLAAESGPTNRSGSALLVTIAGHGEGAIAVDELAGTRAGAPLHVAGLPGQAPHVLARSAPELAAADRSRFDFFVSSTHAAIFEEGQELGEFDLPRALPFAQARAYFTHFVTRTAAALADLRAAGSAEPPWLAFAPYSDERHWNDLGFETLPAGTPWNTLGQLARPAQRVAAEPAT